VKADVKYLFWFNPVESLSFVSFASLAFFNVCGLSSFNLPEPPVWPLLPSEAMRIAFGDTGKVVGFLVGLVVGFGFLGDAPVLAAFAANNFGVTSAERTVCCECFDAAPELRFRELV